MINKRYAKKFCCQDPSLIENYELAIVDQTLTWDCHHRGLILPCGRFSRDDLKKFGLYYKRQASELIFLPHDEHARLHKQGVSRPDLKCISLSEAHKQKLSDALKGVPKSEATKKAISEAKSKKILLFTKSGEFVREWASMQEVQRVLGISQGNISACCQGNRKSAGSYVWKYA